MTKGECAQYALLSCCSTMLNWEILYSVRVGRARSNNNNKDKFRGDAMRCEAGAPRGRQAGGQADADDDGETICEGAGGLGEGEGVKAVTTDL